MSDTVIKVENLSKAYQIGQIGTGTVSRDIERFVRTRVLGKEDPFLKIGEANDRSKKGSSDIVWSLRDINFEINQGDAVGIIGKNGAGKSTLLKLLSRVTSPTTGQIGVKGRIASLLEVGTGFHPELTGRENIYLNGAILGMRKKEITRKLDEIIDFSGVERYIDTPVKRYSSGMYVRLAFAVAAHLESEILIVDEVLAVGDAEFQKKCLGKMGDISKGQGRTILFVSHNMAAVQNLCSRGIVLKNGAMSFDGNVDMAVGDYLKQSISSGIIDHNVTRVGNGAIRLREIAVYGSDRHIKPQTGQPFTMEFSFDNPNFVDIGDLGFDVRIDDYLGQRIAWFSNTILPSSRTGTVESLRFMIEKLSLNDGLYYVTIQATVQKQVADWIQNVYSFEVSEGDFFGSGKRVPSAQSKVVMDFTVK
ncbi:ABC transporter ATP-binding protein [Flavobacterium selenitireducens]|uniref:ABC transporter ATP-binding protein n=1 Tax=Flavobacterium selenitireducens TaxID=2722704 RepID=UPI00168B7EEB|nr:ABC transporter ATP-binding protein [Flavobacterium selenitireducens]MBD3583443.1 ABC transporter ATP-binding protein [Flavobacterium selenitireducens]